MECRERTRSEQRRHLAAIAAIVDRWQAGEIDLMVKRQLIARENAFFHGRKSRGRSGKLITQDAAEPPPLPEHEPQHDTQDELWWQEA